MGGSGMSEHDLQSTKKAAGILTDTEGGLF